MVNLQDIVNYCYQRLDLSVFPDFEGAHNGLQISNNGSIKRIGCAVDANLTTFQKAVEQGVDCLIVHHGLFWDPMHSITGKVYDKIKYLIDNNLAVISYHLPLDGHPILGNNAIIAKKIDLKISSWGIPYKDRAVVPFIKDHSLKKDTLRRQLSNLFDSVIALEYGLDNLGTIAICSGSASLVVQQMIGLGVNTLVAGELRQSVFSLAQDYGLNLYACGHYATETLGVDALGKELSDIFKLPYVFIDNHCPL